LRSADHLLLASTKGCDIVRVLILTHGFPMAKPATKTEIEDFPLTSAKLKRLVVKNFRCIGPDPVSIDLDDIVVLVGPNNAGKSTILRAYEVIMLHGSSEGKLKIEDFPREQFDADNVPEIELQTYVYEDFPGLKWIHTEAETGQKFIRERWRWEAVGANPKRQGRRADAEDWDESVPWGAPGIANARRPFPHRVDAFASPEDQSTKLVKLLTDILLDRARKKNEEGISLYDQLTDSVRALQKELIKEAEKDVKGIEESLTKYVGEIFVGYQVKLDPKTDEVSERAINIFQTTPVLRMGPDLGHLSPLEKQGSGARRTLLWSALKIAADRQPDPVGKGAKTAKKASETEAESSEVTIARPNVLLLDEPEICLHPSAVRDACRVLYDLAEASASWQVMVTTHSPVFIDVSRDNTTIVRVERTATGSINGTTIFRPEKAKLTDDEKEKLKILNQWDPYFCEFFFGGQSVIVEGDTEYSAFREIIETYRSEYRDVHIVRARGKFIVPTLAKIMNHFGRSYSILHDSDRRMTRRGDRANPAWAANKQICEVVRSSPEAKDIRLAASIVDFESAIFGGGAASDKPYQAVERIRNDPAARAMVKGVLDFLLFRRSDSGCSRVIAWSDEADLDKAIGATGTD
jgi:putative ATP-dependent endonuclease of OLD family